jgi:hypothetical protein
VKVTMQMAQDARNEFWRTKPDGVVAVGLGNRDGRWVVVVRVEREEHVAAIPAEVGGVVVVVGVSGPIEALGGGA